MSTTRQRALEAAITVVGEGGMRALTHVRVDAQAQLPAGSTSNWFRTRAALIAGVIDSIAEQERRELSADEPPADAASLIDTLTRTIEAQTDAHRLRTRARLTLFLEASPLAQTPLHEQRTRFEEWMVGRATQLGMRDPEAAAHTLLACGNGLIMHRLTVDADAAVRPVVERVVHGCLTV